MHPRVGVGVILFNEKSEILVGKRKGSHGAGQWALPGGALEWGETSRECALRETQEEVGIDLLHETTTSSENVFSPEDDDEEKGSIFHACECQIDEKNHWITLFALFYVGEGLRGRERTMEPHKCEGWFWKKTPNIDGPMFAPPAVNAPSDSSTGSISSTLNSIIFPKFAIYITYPPYAPGGISNSSSLLESPLEVSCSTGSNSAVPASSESNNC